MSKIIAKYGAVGDYGVEFMADTEKEVQDWIDLQIKGEGLSDEPILDDYYTVYPYSQEEIDNLIED